MRSSSAAGAVAIPGGSDLSRAWCTSRREFLAMLATLGAGALLPAGKAQAQAAPAGGRATPHRIDVHQHILPPRYVEEVGVDRIFQQAARGFRAPLQWTPAKSVEEMDTHGVATAITSVSAPGVWFGNTGADRRLARECNDYAAQMVRDYPGRFGVFAALPLPDVEGSLRELEYALDALKAEGIALMTSYGDKWPGDPAFAPVFEELDRRKAVVFFHPTVASCCRYLLPDVWPAGIEFPLDTTRAVTSLLYSGTFSRLPDIRFIFCHAGGTVPFLADRITRLELADRSLAARLPHGAMYELRRLFYDVAAAATPAQLDGLLHLVRVSQVLFGSDYPWAPGQMAAAAAGLAKYGFGAADLQAIERGNALRLFPRLKA